MNHEIGLGIPQTVTNREQIQSALEESPMQVPVSLLNRDTALVVENFLRLKWPHYLLYIIATGTCIHMEAANST